MKKSTLIALLVALALGAGVYYFEFKRPPSPGKTEDGSKPAFSFQAEDLRFLRIERAGQGVSFEKRGGTWAITQPVETQADPSVIEGIAAELASARITRTLPAEPDRMAAYGLASPGVMLEFQAQKGAKHRLKLGAKDFTGLSVYGVVDDAKEVALLPQSLLSLTDKPLDELRDRSVLDLAAGEVPGFTLKNAFGEITAAKQATGWMLESPRKVAADSGEVDSLLAQVAAAKMTRVESETPANLSKYGLRNPVLSFRARTSSGGMRELLIGKKVGDAYYARDTSRPMIFLVSGDIYKKLDLKFFDLRDKGLLRFDVSDLNRVEIRNQNQTVVAVPGSEGKWVLEQPTSNKGKEVLEWKFFDPLESARAREIYDRPPAGIAARLSKPAVEVTLTHKSGRVTKIDISAESAGSVYARTSEGTAAYKLGKQILDDLSFKVSDLLS